MEEAVPIAVEAVKDFLAKESSIKVIYLVLFDDQTYEAYVSAA